MTHAARFGSYHDESLERFALIGISHRRGGISALEAWQGGLGRAGLERLVAAGLREWALLETCNRWDLLLVLPLGLDVRAARRLLVADSAAREPAVQPYAYGGEGALEQLCRVAASLDSLNPGEDQIMAQVRAAFAAAQAQGRSGHLLNFAFQTALKIAKKVRREIALAPVNTSLFSLALPELAARLAPGDRVAVLGAGAMGSLAAKSLRELPGLELLIVNRSPARAEALARQLGGASQGLDAFLANPPPVQALVTTLPLHHVLDLEVLARLPELKLVVDLGVPRNVCPQATAALELRVLDVDSLQQAGERRREALREKLAQAEALIQSELELELTAWTEKQLGPSIRQLRDWYRRTIGDSLPEDEAARLAHKFAHVPVKGLRALAREYGLDAARTFLAETGLSE